MNMNSSKQGSPSVSRSLLTGMGTYNVRATEVAREKKQSTVNISIVLLDHTEVVFKINKRDRGQVLLDLVYQHLRVTEIKFFGLQFLNDVPDTMRWLDPTKSIRKQFKRGYPYILFFRVKFYANDLSSMKDEFTRYQLFLQIKLDLLEKRLQCPVTTSAMIASYAVQSELGDYNSEEHKNNYIAEFHFLPNQNEEFELEVCRLHKLHRGLSPSQAEYQFIKKAQKLDMYGVEMHHAKDNNEEDLNIGVTSSGMILYQNGVLINGFKWSTIVKISFKRKQFYIQLRPESLESNLTDLIFSFHMDNYRACKRLWKSCVDFHSFYRLDRCMNSSCTHQHNSSDVSNDKSEKHKFAFLTLGSRGKKEQDDNSSTNDISPHRVYLRTRSGSTKSKLAANSSLNGDAKSREEKAPRRLSAPPSVSYGVGGSGLSDKEMIAVLKDQQSKDFTPEKHLPRSREANSVDIPSPVALPIQFHGPDPNLAASFRKLHIRTDAVGDGEGVEVDSVEPSVLNSQWSECSSVITSLTDKSYTVNSTNLPFPHQPMEANGVPSDLVVVRIKPDKEGRYGFNVKGGADQQMPIVVSKVADNSPASTCHPCLHEGDQVLQINSRDVMLHTHEQVVRFIRSTREPHTGELVLLIRPKEMFIASDNQQEPDTFFQPIENNANDDEGALLHKSMQWIEDMLDSGEILAKFDALYRKKPGATTDNARIQENLSKNRYRDISPYDSTRVTLQYGTTDYINANHVNMHISGSNWTNHYIASQGPLPNTSIDFWTMVWEKKSTLIVMLTTVVERGRQKCHQYWPDEGMAVQYGPWIIESVSEEQSNYFAFRDFKLYQHIEEGEENCESEIRSITQMQYIAWPDHGVPDDSSDFLEFVLRVRQNRVGMVNPCVVHCSAGIGRTGVLITMETAMCLIEANQAVYPIEIARTMRDQRAMMIQTPNQFKFVCDAILRVYKEGLAKPMKEDDFDQSSGEEEDINNIAKQSETSCNS